MFVFFFMLYCFFFLVVGAVVFVFCGSIPKLRRFALSAALWCAMWGPCVIAWGLSSGMASFAADYVVDKAKLPQPWWESTPAIGLFWVAVLSSALVATAVAWLHQILVRRLTFALFRVYAALVSAGVGSVWGWVLGFVIAVYQVRFGLALGVVGMIALVGAFGYEGYRLAKQLRGAAPERFAWVTREEFEGTV